MLVRTKKNCQCDAMILSTAEALIVFIVIEDSFA